MSDHDSQAPILPPSSIEALMTRARGLSGMRLADVAQAHGFNLPDNNVQAKGWSGIVLETVLGAQGRSDPEPDFPALGVELKTLPIDAQGRVLESTFVSTIPLMTLVHERWETSTVYKKLKHVLWMPLIWTRGAPVQSRTIGAPLLWQPSLSEMQQLQSDWEELSNMICLGEIDNINARFGRWLHIRPKGASKRCLVDVINRDGECVKTLPRGFYLRPAFTQYILKQYFYCE